MQTGRRLASLLLLVLGAGCTCGDQAPEGTTFVERENPDRFPACATPGTCAQAYGAFIDKAASHARPLAEDDLWSAMWPIVREEVQPQKAVPEGSSLAAEVRDAARVGWLLDSLAEQTVQVTRGYSGSYGSGVQTELQFDDPWVGRFDALLIHSAGPGRHPAVVAQPGHSENAVYHRDHRLVQPLVEAGYAVLILEARVNEGDEKEHELALRLLLQGHTLIGLRAYEVALARRYMQQRRDVDPARVALMGHSGGSSTINLLALIDPCFAALVSDHTTWYMAHFEQDGQLSDEASPDLWQWNELISSTPPPMPVLRQAYGYPDGPEPVLGFLENTFAIDRPICPG